MALSDSETTPFYLEKSRPAVMGILNATPDSFSDGGQHNSLSSGMDKIHIMIKYGATIIDVGGESTRPGAAPVSEEEELNRVIPLLKASVPAFGSEAVFSVDTTKYEVARAALDAGVKIINDVSGMQNEPRLADLCAEYDAAYVIMHSQGSPETMQDNPEYGDVVEDVYSYLREAADKARDRGVKHVILDPGIGFGKTRAHNLKLLARLDKFTEIGFPVLIGASRKSVIGQVLGGRPVEERLTGTLAFHYHALMKGADIIRVHDVKEADDTVKIYQAVQSQLS